MKKNITKIKLVLTVIFSIGFIVNGVLITIYNVDKSVSVGEVSGDINRLKSENNKLIGNISRMDSLTNFEERSDTLGFDSAGMRLYFDQNDTVAAAR